MATKITKITDSDHRSHMRPPQHGTPRISSKTLHHLKVESMGYTFTADSMGLSSFKFPQ